MVCWESRMTAERPTRRSWSENDLDMCTTSWTSFLEKVGNCQTICAPSSSMTGSSQVVMRHKKYECKDEKQTKLAPTAECYGLDALETVKTSSGETARDVELPEDLCPNLNAMVTRLQQLYIGNHEVKLAAREHGFRLRFLGWFSE